MDDDVVTSGGYVPPEDPSLLPDIRRRFFTRRKFIGMTAGSAVGGGVLLQNDAASAGVQDVLNRVRARVAYTLGRARNGVGGRQTAPTGRSLIFDMLRREDMLRLRFELYNLVPSSSNANLLVKSSNVRKAHIVVTFPPQHLAEEALLRVGERDPRDPPVPVGDGANEFFGPNDLARLRLSGASRIVLEVPSSALPLPRTQSALLNWANWSLKLAPGARTENDSSGPAINPPKLNTTTDEGETALELPWRLQVSPLPGAGWLHPTTLPAASIGGGYSLWHTRLGVRMTLLGNTLFVTERGPRSIRALWNTDPFFKPDKSQIPKFDVYDDDDMSFNTTPEGDGDKDGTVFEPFRTSLSPRNRVQIVQNSAGFKKQSDSKKVAPIHVNRLMLSPLGGFLDVEGKWDKPVSVDLLLWRHRAALGRDVYVQIVERGFFMPWGFPGLRIKVTERAVENRVFGGQTVNVAFLRQRVHYVILDPTLDYPAVGHSTVNDGRDLPFRSIRSKTLITPDVTDDVNLFTQGMVPSFGPPSRIHVEGGSPDDAFRFDLEATDWEGRVISWRQPMAFVYASQVSGDDSNADNRASSVRVIFNQSADPVLRTVPVNGQKLAFAQASTAGDTAYEANTLSIRTEWNLPSAATSATQARFVPTMRRANLRIEAADTFSGKAEGGTDVTFAPFYLTSAFNNAANKTGTFLKIESPKSLAFENSESTGGVASPSLSLTALSRAKGAIGGSDASLQNGAFVPSEWFGTALNANMLGLKLTDIIATGNVTKAMTLATTEISGGVKSELKWTPDLKGNDILIVDNNKSRFTLNALAVRKDDGTTTQEVRGEVKDVTLRLLGTSLEFMHIEVKRLVFESRTGTSPDLDVKLGEIKFVGALTFVNELREILANKDGAFGVEVSGAGIEARGGISVPALTVGIFSLKNLALSVGVKVPFSGEPTSATFAISSKKDPFLVAVSIFGGGGWFSLEVDTNGLKAIEAGFEFGGVLAMDFGVAAGSIEVMAGIYFRFEKVTAGNKITLSGYVRLTGEVRVGFVSIGLIAELGLTYVSKPRQGLPPLEILTGRCQVTLDLPVAPDVSFEIEKSFGGDPHDPRYVQQVTETEWLAYVGAFDEEDAA